MSASQQTCLVAAIAGVGAPTSLYLLMREPADLANLPVASWADCLPPALALQPDA